MFTLETMRVPVAIVFLSFMDLVFTRRYGQSPCGHLFSGLVHVALLLWNKLWMIITYPWSDQLVFNHHYYTELRRRESQTDWKSQVTKSVHDFLMYGEGPIAMRFYGNAVNLPEAERYKMALRFLMDELHLNV